LSEQSTDLLQPLAIAGFQLAAISIAALSKAGLLSADHCEMCVAIVDDACDQLEQAAQARQLAQASLAQFRQLADQLAQRISPRP
jgi:hypothetical protein